MKRLLILLVLTLFMAPLATTQDEPIPPKRSRMAKMGLFGGFTPGYLFVDVKPINAFLAAGKGESAHADVANALGMEEGAVRVAVHRLRKRYRQLLRDEIASTLSDPAMVDEEMRALFGAFAV